MAFLMLFLLATAQAADSDKALLKTPQDKKNYALGVDLARNIRRQGLEVDVDLVIRGLKDGLSDQKLLVPEREFRQLLINVQTELRQRQANLRGRTLPQINQKRSEQFLAENTTKPGVVTLPSGLQYKVLQAGTGNKPTATDTVECYYRGTLLDGAEFICTNPGQPAAVQVKAADFAGWREALVLMPVGSKWRLFVPPQLAYGPRGVGQDIGPNEAVILDLELIAIK